MMVPGQLETSEEESCCKPAVRVVNNELNKEVLYQSNFLRMETLTIRPVEDYIHTATAVESDVIHIKLLFSDTWIEEYIDQQIVFLKPQFFYIMRRPAACPMRTIYKSDHSYCNLDIRISREIAPALYEDLPNQEIKNNNPLIELPISDKLIKIILEFKKLDNKDLSNIFLIIAKLFYFLNEVQLVKNEKENQSHSIYNPVDRQKFAAIKSYIQNQYDRFPTIAFMAKEFGMNSCKLKKGFKDIFGLGLFEYANHVRMEVAINLLELNACSIKEIAFQLGYTTPSAFSNAFKRYFGYPPKQYPLR
ncbi:helix-turn-helix domain-containing protein [Sphingobacterium sp. HJSM2_6]|uniref:helix-turn-helix domain-containing protein n=1 Tax=Sphingobacterium sp. HJSM2_6 TaxID=3366264 RepID=UPI003BE21E6F